MTGQVIKLVYADNVVDEAIMVVRGDLNRDGIVDTTDYMIVYSHYLETDEITDFITFMAGDIVEDEAIDTTDLFKIYDYYLETIDSLNN